MAANVENIKKSHSSFEKRDNVMTTTAQWSPLFVLQNCLVDIIRKTYVGEWQRPERRVERQDHERKLNFVHKNERIVRRRRRRLWALSYNTQPHEKWGGESTEPHAAQIKGRRALYRSQLSIDYWKSIRSKNVSFSNESLFKHRFYLIFACLDSRENHGRRSAWRK